MKAIIMAGGEGSRLRPLTCDTPKPMMRLMDKPLMEYAIELLRRHRITEIAVTLGYLPDAVMDYFGDGSDFGVSIRYYVEKTPLGTAGSVYQARAFLDETFIVLSGDGVTDIDLNAAVEFHRAQAAQATLVLYRSAAPQEYGVVLLDEGGRVRGFREKPGRLDLCSDCVNTGIYLLEPEIFAHISPDAPCDFGHDVFPALLDGQEALYGFQAEGYWCDVGDVGAYLRVHADAMDGRIRLESLSDFRGAVRAAGASIDRGAILEAPCFVAPGARIHAGARVLAHAVVGEGCAVEGGASLKRCVLWRGARACAGAQLRGCVLAANATAGEGAQIYEDCVVGTDSRVGERAVLLPGVKLWPEKCLSDGERGDSNVVWGSRRGPQFAAGALRTESPAQAARACEACAAQLGCRELLLARSESPVASALWHAAVAGALSQGVRPIDAGTASLPQLRHAQAALRADAAMLVEDERLIPLDADGCGLPDKAQRALLKLYERQDFSGPFRGETPEIVRAGRTDIAYIAQLAERFEADAAYAPKLALHAQSPLLLRLSEAAARRAGLTLRSTQALAQMELAPDELGIFLDPRGERAALADEAGMLDEARTELLLAWTALELGETRLILPAGATRAVSELAQGYGAQAVYLNDEPAQWLKALAGRSKLQFALQTDGLFFAFSALSRLTDTGWTLSRWREAMPRVYRHARSVPVPDAERGRVLRALSESEPQAETGGGLRLPRERGWAFIRPDEHRPELKIVTEAASAEFAGELCDFFEGRLKRLLEAPPVRPGANGSAP